jgi:hypothetical protein
MQVKLNLLHIQVYFSNKYLKLCLFYLVSPSIQSHITNSLENEQNQSILSFPDHETPSSEESEEVIDDDNQLKLSAQTLVDDLIQDAQEKYQRV